MPTALRIAYNRHMPIGSLCERCNKPYYPPTTRCPGCLAQNLQQAQFSDRGSLYSYSKIHVAQRGHAAPYTVAYVDLPEGIRVFGKVEAESEDFDIGDSVDLVEVLEGSPPRTALRFRPVSKSPRKASNA